MFGLSVIDFIFIGIMIATALISMMRGLMQELFRLIAWVLAIFLTILLYPYSDKLFLSFIPFIGVANAIAIIVPFVIMVIIFTIISHYIFSKIKDKVYIPFDYFLGFIYGAGFGWLYIVIAYWFFVKIMGEEGIPLWLSNGFLFPYVQTSSAFLVTIIPQDIFNSLVNFFN